MFTTYKQFEKYQLKSLKETLNHSVEINTAVVYLNNNIQFDEYDFKIQINNKFSFTIELKNIQKFENIYNEEYFNIILNKFLIIGYYPSYFKIFTTNNDIKFKNKFNRLKFLEIIKNNYDIITEIILTCESHVEDSVYKNTNIIPDKLYHLAPKRIINDILKEGLLPNKKGRISEHPYRIYFFDKYDDVFFKIIVDDFKHNDYKKYMEEVKNKSNDIKKKFEDKSSDFYKYILIEINTNDKNIELNNQTLKDTLVLHSDANSQGYFSTDRIPKDYINIIKEY